MSIKENLKKIQDQIPGNVTIVAAVKSRNIEEVREIIDAGITNIGENYIQEGELAYSQLGDLAQSIRFHMIGHLQTNKINKTLAFCDLIQTVDSLKKARAINSRVPYSNKLRLPVFIEVNIGNESNKSGVLPEFTQIENLAIEISKLNNLHLQGLMTMGPVTENPESLRPYFRHLKIIFDQLKAKHIPNTDIKTLSMGMSASYKIAIEEGSNMVRIGSGLFGPRKR